MKNSLFVLTAILALAVGCGKKQDPNVGVSAVTAPLDYLAAQGRAKQTAIKVTSLAEVTQAIQKFQAMEDRLPRDLNELVQQHYLGALPAEPNGAHLVYNPQTGEAHFVRVVPGQTPTVAPPPNAKLPGVKNLPPNGSSPQ